MKRFTGCADRSTWQDMLEERFGPQDQQALLAHLEECPLCAETVAELAGQWSLATLVRPGATEGPTTRVIRERLEQVRPAIPTPEIPGIGRLELAGQGGMGAVFRGHDERLGRMVAVKVLGRAAILSAASRARAAREARALAAVDHPHIVRIHAAGETDGYPYIVMEWIEGRTLQARVDAGVVPAREAARIALHLAEALVAVHAVGIVHRDLKPANVLLARPADPGGSEVPKLVDFGLARPDDGRLTRTTAVLGTPCFMAPEQTGLEPGLGGVVPGTDIHGLGAVLYCMLVGRPPYDAATAGESLRRAARADVVPLSIAAPRVPADLQTIVETCLRFEVAGRYRSAAALADDLARFLDRVPIAARPAGPIQRLRSWARRHPATAVAAFSCGLLVLMATVGVAVHIKRLERANTTIQASRDAASSAQSLARQSLQRLTDESIEALLLRGPALGEKDREFLEAVRDELVRWPLEPDPGEALAFRARGLQRVSNLFRRLQRLPDALACQDLVIGTLDEMVQRGFVATRVDEQHVAARTGRCQLLFDLGKFEESLKEARGLVADLEGLAGTSPSGLAQLAGAVLFLAIAEDAQGDQAAGQALVTRGLELFTRATEAAPENRHLLEEEARAVYNSAVLSLQAGRVEEWRDRLERLVQRCEDGIARLTDGSQTLSHSLLLGLAGLAGLELNAGRPDAALVLTRRREQAAHSASDRYPDSGVFRGECVDAAIQMSICHEAVGSMAEAYASSVEAVRLAEEAFEREPAVLDRAMLLAVALTRKELVCEQIDVGVEAQGARDRRRTVLMPWKERAAVASLLVEDAGAEAAAEPR